jgi:hypothetical protein
MGLNGYTWFNYFTTLLLGDNPTVCNAFYTRGKTFGKDSVEDVFSKHCFSKDWKLLFTLIFHLKSTKQIKR